MVSGTSVFFIQNPDEFGYLKTKSIPSFGAFDRFISPTERCPDVSATSGRIVRPSSVSTAVAAVPSLRAGRVSLATSVTRASTTATKPNLTMQTIGKVDFGSLTRRGQIARLRRLARAALGRYGLEQARLRLLQHEHNTTWRVDASGHAYVLRMNRPGVHTTATIESELAWLAALRRDTDLGVPEPVAAHDSLVVVAHDEGVPEPHACVLVRWLDGRFVDERLSPVHLRRVGALQGGLQSHASSWKPPTAFVRPRVETLTTAGRRASLAPSADAARAGVCPTHEDGERARQLVDTLVSNDAAALFARALEHVRETTRALAEDADGFGLVHADLHYENFLFLESEAQAIDFDDCGWGLHLYDVAVTLWELEQRPHYAELRDAHLETYAEARQLPADYERHLGALFVLRRMQMLLWILESREHAAFRDSWPTWAREEVDGIARALAATERP